MLIQGLRVRLEASSKKNTGTGGTQKLRMLKTPSKIQGLRVH